MEMATDHVIGRVERPLHLSFDIDSIDPLFAPSTGTRVSGGLNYREAYYIAESCADTGMLAGMDLVEVNPDLSSDEGRDMTVEMAVGLISSAMGNKII
jgi:arginase